MQVAIARLCKPYLYLKLDRVDDLASIQPKNTRWMSEYELRLAQARLSEDVGEADKDNEEDSCANHFLGGQA